MSDKTSMVIMVVAIGVPTVLIVAAGFGWTDWMVNP